MIVADTSAIIAVLFEESDADDYLAVMASAAPQACISVVSMVEASIIAARVSEDLAARDLDALVHSLNIRVHPVDLAQMTLARSAFLAFGKGRGHPARLNICDCFSYALAKHLNAPLLFKGNDFGQTDLPAAIAQGGARP